MSDFGYFKILSPDNGDCNAEGCYRSVAKGKEAFLGPEGRLYCEGCGKVLRYEAKKAMQRNEMKIRGLQAVNQLPEELR